ncbi:MAG: hypothetical protein H0X37_22405 [Herpetosiphonaceae bacterium]|nr:hypothetical protein [Herpetosiphonaceae bacterium]
MAYSWIAQAAWLPMMMGKGPPPDAWDGSSVATRVGQQPGEGVFLAADERCSPLPDRDRRAERSG